MIDISVSYGSTPVRFSYAWVCSILKFVLNKEGVRHMSVGVRFVDDAEMTLLNARYRKRRRPTDVLSFAYDASGDIVIDVQYVRRSARAVGGALRAHVGMLLIHGMLHILGYDHGRRDAARVMWKKQDAYAARMKAERIAFEDFG